MCSRCTGILSWARRRGFRLPMVLLSLICRSPCLCCQPPFLAAHVHANVDGDPPLLSDILADSALSPPLTSRMP